MLRRTKTKNRKKIWLVAVLILIVAVSGGAITLSKHHKKSPTVANKPVALPTTVNYGPPTSAEKQESDQNKNAIVQQQSQPPVSGSKTVTPVITRVTQSSDGTVTVAAYVSGVVEDSGTCQLVATHTGSSNVQQGSTGFANATTTNCTVFSIPRSQFGSAGAWIFTVSYSSSDAQGTSQTLTQNVQ